MLKKVMMTMLVAATAASGSVVMADAGDIGVTAAVDSKYIWRGFDVFDDHGIYSANLNVDLGSGFAFDLWSGAPIGSGNEDARENNYIVSYAGTCGAGETGQVDYGVNFIYYDFYKVNSDSDGLEVGITLDLPNVFQLLGSPVGLSYALGHVWSDDGNFGSGQYQNVALGSTIGTVDVSVDLGHWRGFAGNDGGAIDGGASHIGCTLGTALEVAGHELSPYISYQHSLEDNVNADSDEVSGGISLSF
jgi:hypothetical protein